MTSSDATQNSKLPKGVSALPKARWGRQYLASIRTGKGVTVHLGLYENPWHAALAYGFAADMLKRPRPPLRIPNDRQPSADQVRQTWERVQIRLGLASLPPVREVPPTPAEILTLFEITVIPFWRSQAVNDQGDHHGNGLELAALRLIESANVLFRSRSAGHPSPIEALTEALSRRLEFAFRRSRLTRDVLDDERADELGLARWLVYPNEGGGGLRPFADEVRVLYADHFGSGSGRHEGDRPDWAAILDVEPPYDLERIRTAFLNRTRKAHPDAGGTDEAFIKVRMAYEEAVEYCRLRGI